MDTGVVSGLGWSDDDGLFAYGGFGAAHLFSLQFPNEASRRTLAAALSSPPPPPPPPSPGGRVGADPSPSPGSRAGGEGGRRFESNIVLTPLRSYWGEGGR